MRWRIQFQNNINKIVKCSRNGKIISECTNSTLLYEETWINIENYSSLYSTLQQQEKTYLFRSSSDLIPFYAWCYAIFLVSCTNFHFPHINYLLALFYWYSFVSFMNIIVHLNKNVYISESVTSFCSILLSHGKWHAENKSNLRICFVCFSIKAFFLRAILRELIEYLMRLDIFLLMKCSC